MSPNGGITSPDGSANFALVTTGVFTQFDGYRSEFVDGLKAGIDIYLDPEWMLGEGFNYTVAANGQNGSHLRDFAFHATKDTSSGELLVNASTGSAGVREDLDTLGDSVEITTAGWYRFEHTFRDDNGVLAVDLTVTAQDGTVVFTRTISEAGDLIDSLVGGNRYGWFTAATVTGGLAVDNVTLGDQAVALTELMDGDPDETTGTLTVSGVLPFRDVDLLDTHSVSVTSDTTGFVGTLTPVIVNDATNDGEGAVSYTFAVLDDAIEHLNAGQTLTQVYTVTVADDNGGTGSRDVTVTITGTNDAPTIEAAGETGFHDTTDEDATSLTIDLTALSDDVDAEDDGASLAYALVSGPGAGNGTVTVSATGELVFTLGSDFQDLAMGEQQDVTIRVSATDAQGAMTEQDIVIRVTGTNDAPVVGFDQDFESGTEGFSPFGTGTVTQVMSPNGGITSPDGSANFALVTTGVFTQFDGYRSEFVDGLKAGIDIYLDPEWMLGEGFNYTVAANGQNGSHLRDFAFHATKDTSSGELLVNASTGSAGVREDLDTLGDSVEITTAGWYRFEHTFRDDNGVLAVDLTVTAQDGTVVFTRTISEAGDLIDSLVGGNRYGWFTAATVTGGLAVDNVTLGDQAVALTELMDGDPDETTGTLTVSGVLPFRDVDLLDTHSVSVTSDTTGFVGTLTPVIVNDATNDGEGAVSYTFAVLDDAIEHLNAGQTLTQVYTVTVADDNGGTGSRDVTVTITGTNDAPTIEAAGETGFHDTTDEDATSLTIDLTALSDDVDAEDDGASLAYALVSGPGAGNGTVTVSATGELVFTLGSDFQDLAMGEQQDVTIRVSATDAQGAMTEQDIVIRVTGTNDAPVAADVTSANDATEGNGQTSTQEFVIADLATDVDDVLALENITLTGATLNGALVDPAALGLIYDPNFGTFSLDANAAAYDFLAAGETATVTAIFTAIDDDMAVDTGSVTFTVNGTNDAPIITVEEGDDSIASVAEDDAPMTASGTLTASDVDLTDTATVSLMGVVAVSGDQAGNPALPGTAALQLMLTLPATAVLADDETSARFDWSFDGGTDAFDFLDAGETLTLTYTVGIADDNDPAATNTFPIVIQITGGDDAPTATAVDPLTVDDTAGNDLFTAVTGAITANVTDTRDTLSYRIEGEMQEGNETSLAGSYGTLVLNATTGAYTYTPDDAAVEALKDTQTDTFTLEVVDSDGLTDTIILTVTLNGVNDTPVVTAIAGPTVSDDGMGSEDALPVVIDLLSGGQTDRDNDVLSVDGVAVTTSGMRDMTGLFTLTGSEISIDPDVFDDLDDGQSETVTITYNVNDGAVDVQNTATFTVTGTNDRPFIVGTSDVEGAVVEEGPLSATGTITFGDNELSDVHTVFVAPVATAGTPLTTNYIGSFGATPPNSSNEIDWTFSINNSTINRLGEGEEITQTYRVTVIDNGAVPLNVQQFITITITGTNDTPVITSVTAPTAQVEGDDAGEPSVQTVMASGSLAVSDADFGGTLAGLSQVADVLTPSVQGDATAVYKQGAVAALLPASVNIAALVANANLAFADASQAALSGGNSFAFTYTGAAALDWLNDGESLELTYTVQIADDSGAASGTTATNTVTITITGSNDGPVAAVADIPVTTVENIADTVVVATADFADADLSDTLTYSITGGDMNDLFEIDAMGAISLQAGKTLDADPATGGAAQYVLTIEASDGIATATQTVTIDITDLDDNATTAPADGNGDANEVLENVAPGTGTGIQVASTDDDRTAGVISYSIVDGTGAAKFTVDAGGNVVLAPGQTLDREVDGETLTVVVLATPTNGSASTETTFTITILDQNEFSVSVPTDANTDDNVVSELATGGATVGVTAEAFDADATTNTVTYSLAAGVQDNDLFDIDGTTGEVTVKTGADLDRETGTATRTIEVTATSADTSVTTAQFTITVTDEDEFDVTLPVDTTGVAGGTVDENATGGTEVGITASASDLDATTNAVTYTITGGNGAALFDIDPVNGVVTVKDGATLDYEAHISLEIVVRATSEDASFAEETFTISLNNLNDTAPVFTSADTASVAEGDTAVTTLTATDADNLGPVTFSIVGGEDSGAFTLNGTDLVFGGAPNFEMPTDTGSDNSYVVTVEASDGTNTTVQTITVTVTDVNEAPTAVAVNDGVTSVDENVDLSAGIKVGDIAITDDAIGMNDIILTGADAEDFQIRNGTELFFIGGAQNFEAPSDFDGDGTFDVTVSVSDAVVGSEAVTASFSVSVNDVNEAPVADADVTETVAEDVDDTTTLATASGNDVDAGDAISFTITGGNTGGLFEIDANGAITLVAGQSLDADPATGGTGQHVLTVTLTDNGNLTTTQQVTLNVTDVDDNATPTPVDLDGAAGGAISEGATGGDGVGITVNAADADVTAAEVTYAITDGTGLGIFAIDPSTGVVTLAPGQTLDRETVDSYTIEVTATANTAGAVGSTETFTISVTDENDNAPVITSASSASVAENSTAVLMLASSDADTTGTNPATFTVTGGADGGLFDVVGNTLVFNTAPDFEANGSDAGNNTYVVEVTANDGVNSTVQTVTVSVTDVNEAPTAVAVDSGVTSVDENVDLSGGIKVGDITITDDALGMNEITLTGADAGDFEIRNGTELFFVGGTQNFEAPGDAGADGSFNVTVSVSDPSILGGGIVPLALGPVGVTSDFTVTINDVNDAPAVSSVDPSNGNEDAAGPVIIDLFGLVTATDEDAGDVPAYGAGSVMVVAAAGSDLTDTGLLTVDQTDGTISYTQGTFDALGEGQSAVFDITFDVVSGVDTVSQTVTLTIDGENDAPVIDIVDPAAFTEGDTGTASPQSVDLAALVAAGATDVDQTDMPALDADSVTITAAPGQTFVAGLLTHSGGVVSFDATAFDSLPLGGSATFTVDFDLVSGSDRVAQQITITIDGENDAPTVAGPLTATSLEDAPAVTLNLLQGATDVDTGETATLAVANAVIAAALTPNGGVAATELVPAGVSLSPTGVLTVDTLDASFDYLNEGDVLAITVTYDVIDGNGGSVPQSATVTVTGTNDVPIADVATFSTDEDVADASGTLATSANAVDLGSVLTFSLLGAAPDGFDLQPNGDFTFDTTGAGYQGLGAGESDDITLVYQVEDELGSTVTGALTLTVNGVNDDPQVTPVGGGTTNEDASLVIIDLLAGQTDPDDNDVLSVTTIVATARDGGQTVAFTEVNGVVTLDLSSFNGLAVGESDTIDITYAVSDGTASVPNTASLVVEGRNDAPEVAAPLLLSVTQGDAPAMLDLLSGATDQDGDMLTVTGLQLLSASVNTSGITIAPDGLSITVDPDFYKILGAGVTETISYLYTIEDGNGGSVEQSTNVVITGIDDLAVAEDDSFSMDDIDFLSGTLFAANGGNADTDIDGDTFTVTAVNGTTGNVDNTILLASGALLTVFSDGTFDYDPNGVFERLAAGVTATETFTYEISGGDTATATVTINGIDNNDELVGGAGADDLNGGIGNDTLLGFGGVDRSTGMLATTRLMAGPVTTFSRAMPETTRCSVTSATTRCAAIAVTTAWMAAKAKTCCMAATAPMSCMAGMAKTRFSAAITTTSFGPGTAMTASAEKAMPT